MESTKMEAKTKIPRYGYGVAFSGLMAVEFMIEVYLLEFFITGLGLDPILGGLALALALGWDAISDPLMGVISDRTRSSAGRRRPYFLWGSVLLAFAFPLLFQDPGIRNQAGLFFYLFGMYLLISTAATVISVPHIALGGEISDDSKERNVLYGLRQLFGMFGLIAAAALPSLFTATAPEDPNERLLYTRTMSSYAASVLVVITAVISYYRTRGWDSPAPPAAKPSPRPANKSNTAAGSNNNGSLGGASASVSNVAPESEVRRRLRGLGIVLKSIASNKPFAAVFIAMTIASVARAFNSALAMHYYKSHLGLSDDQVRVAILGTFIIALSVSIPIWIALANRFGKKPPAVFGVLTLGTLTTILYPIFPKYDLTGPLIMAIIGGALAGSIVLLDSLLADIIDWDKLRTGKSREGLYFGFWRLSHKMSRGLGLAMTGPILALVGFREGIAIQSDTVNIWLSILFGPVVGGFFLVAGLIFMRMRWSDKMHSRIQTLTKRRAKIRKENNGEPFAATAIAATSGGGDAQAYPENSDDRLAEKVGA